MRTFRGTTEGGSSTILGAPFWKQGKTVIGTYRKEWESAVGTCYQFSVDEGQPKIKANMIGNKVTEDGDGSGKETFLDRFSIGGLKGFQIALDDLASNGIVLTFRDLVQITCTGMQPSIDGKKDDMLLFSIDISR